MADTDWGTLTEQHMAINIEERRRRRDQRMAVEQAAEIVQDAAGRGRAITLEWAGTLALVALAAGLVLAARYRQLALPMLGTSLWGGFVMGSLLCNAGVHHGRARLSNLALAIFAGLPVALLPFYFFPAEKEQLPLMVVAGLAGALFGAAVRLVWQLRGTLGSFGELGAAARDGFERAASAIITWLHDAMLKWIFSLFLLAFGGVAIFVAREQHQFTLFWVGWVLVFLIGTTGIWVPGLYHRTKLLVGLRHVGQLAFWLSLLAVPFVEEGPAGDLPYNNKPSLRFAIAGLGLVIVGATWFLQRTSIVSKHGRDEPKKPPERGFAFVLVVFGLLGTLAGAQAFQRGHVDVDETKVAETNLLGTSRAVPADQVQSLTIVQPLENVPFYLDYVEFSDHTSRLLPFLYPGDQYHPNQHGLVKAVRAAAKLNVQSFPDKHSERWTK